MVNEESEKKPSIKTSDAERIQKLRAIWDDMPDYSKRGLEYWVSFDPSLPAFGGKGKGSNGEVQSQQRLAIH